MKPEIESTAVKVTDDSLTFEIETHASGDALAAVLTQDGRPQKRPVI